MRTGRDVPRARARRRSFESCGLWAIRRPRRHRPRALRCCERRDPRGTSCDQREPRGSGSPPPDRRRAEIQSSGEPSRALGAGRRPVARPDARKRDSPSGRPDAATPRRVVIRTARSRACGAVHAGPLSSAATRVTDVSRRGDHGAAGLGPLASSRRAAPWSDVPARPTRRDSSDCCTRSFRSCPDFAVARRGAPQVALGRVDTPAGGAFGRHPLAMEALAQLRPRRSGAS